MTQVTYNLDGTVLVECYGQTMLVPSDVTGLARDVKINAFITAYTPVTVEVKVG